MAVNITLENEHHNSVCVPKTIEERANKFALEKHPYSPFYEEYTKMYIEIATEQKAIDIDKAYEWLYKNADSYDKGNGYHLDELLEDFAKAMEEEI